MIWNKGHIITNNFTYDKKYHLFTGVTSELLLIPLCVCFFLSVT